MKGALGVFFNAVGIPDFLILASNFLGDSNWFIIIFILIILHGGGDDDDLSNIQILQHIQQRPLLLGDHLLYI